MTSNTGDETGTETADASLTVRRAFDAPRERVFRAFADPDELGHWRLYSENEDER